MKCQFRPRIRILQNWAEMTDRAKSAAASMEDAAIQRIASRLAVADTLSETAAAKQAGDCWEKARRARDIWAEIAEAARIPVLHHGLTMTGQRPESEAVIDAFLSTEMGRDCLRLTPAGAREFVPALRTDTVTAAFYSPHELRVESRTAIPAIASWLAERHGVDFHWSNEVHGVARRFSKPARDRWKPTASSSVRATIFAGRFRPSLPSSGLRGHNSTCSG